MKKKYLLFFFYCLPAFIISIFRPYVDSNLMKFYIEETDITAVEFGRFSSILGLINFFFNFYISYFVQYVGYERIMILGSPIIALSTWALFFPPNAFASGGGIRIWFMIFSILKIFPLEMAYENLKYQISNNDFKRELFGVRNWINNFGALFGNFLLIFIDISQYLLFFALLYLLSFVCLIIFLKQNRDLVKISNGAGGVKKKSSKSSNIFNALLGLRYNSAFMYMLYFNVYTSFRQLFYAGGGIFYLTHILELHEKASYNYWIAMFNMANMILSLFSTPFWVIVSKKFGWKNSWLFNYSMQIVWGFLVYMIIYCGEYKVIIYFGAFLILGFFNSSEGFFMDNYRNSVFDYEELLSNKRSEATINSLWGIFGSYLSLPGQSISFFLLTYFGGFDSNKKIQSNKALNFINFQNTIMPCGSGIICLYFLYKFTINDKVHEKILDEIDRRDKCKKDGKPLGEVYDPVLKENIKKKQDTQTGFSLNMGKRTKLIGLVSSLFVTIMLLTYGIYLEILSASSLFSTFCFWGSSITLTMTFLFYKYKVKS